MYSLNVLFKCTNNFLSICPYHLDGRFYETKIPTYVSFNPPTPILCFSNHFNVPFDAQDLSLVTVAMLSFYQSPNKCKSRKIEDIFKHKVSNCYYLHFPNLEIIVVPARVWRLVFSGTLSWLNSQNNLLLGKLYWNRWLAMSLYPRCMLLCSRTEQGREARAMRLVSQNV